MKKRRMIPEELLHSIDVLNTLHGGTSQPIIKLVQNEHYREVSCKVPGLSELDLKVEIHNNFISIYYSQHLESNETGIQIPRVIYYKPIPYFIDMTGISARIEDHFLCVRLPFNEFANGYHKKISIKDL